MGAHADILGSPLENVTPALIFVIVSLFPLDTHIFLYTEHFQTTQYYYATVRINSPLVANQQRPTEDKHPVKIVSYQVMTEEIREKERQIFKYKKP